MQRRAMICVGVMLALSAADAFAQGRQGGRGRGAAAPACETLACDLLADWERTRTLILGIAEAMPEEHYGFKPTAPQQTFAERLLHIAQVDVMLLSGLGATTSAPAIDGSATAKGDVIAQLRRSYDFGAAVLKEFNDTQLLERVTPMPFLGPSASRVRIAYYALQHTQDTYGQLVVYLRLNGITPPASVRGV